MKVEGMLNPRTWLSGLSLVLLLSGTGCGSEAPNEGTQEAPTQEAPAQEETLTSALARPYFQAPFPCGQSWTYSHHSAEVRRALDFVKNGGGTSGQPQLASAAGYATRHYEAGGAGNYIKIDHGGGWTTYYFHLSGFSVPNGTHVAQGQQIGVTGSTGASSGAHVHYEQLLNGVGQDIVLNGVSLAPYPGSYGSRSIVSNNCPVSCVLQGDIKAKYDAVNGPVLLGACRAGELATPDGVGRFNHFERGSIYWTQALGAHVVLGSIHARWEALNWEKGVLGYPITDELTTPDGVGRYNHFERGSIYWTQATGAWEVHGLIREKWKALGWETSPLGYPITGEMKTPDGVGRYNHFRKGTIEGSIYWTQATGAWAVYGAIREKWKSLGWENSALGYPVSDEYAVTGGRESEFQKGFITYNSATGALTVRMK
ncbi:peptidoglycan DD-metalloendopeptidase family protein [Archangium gephyra]|uniref:peptidoglycan DD-metalloendopeptidase family protein n=1 Tax=Archangium gephyra TaxID=48 RepID=UPI003B7DF285